MKRLFICLLLVVIVSLNAGVVQRGFGYPSLVHSRRANNPGDYTTYSFTISETQDSDLEKVYNVPNFTGEDAYLNNEVVLSAAGDINGDGMDDVIFVYEYGSDVGTYNVYNSVTKDPTLDGKEDNSLVAIYDGFDGALLCKFFGAGNGMGFYLVETGDFDADGKDEIALVRHASVDVEDPNLGNDGIFDGSCLMIYDFYLNNEGTLIQDLVWYTSPQDVPNLTPPLEHTDAIFKMKRGYFNNDTAMDLIVMYHYGSVNNLQNDLTKDNSVLVAYDVVHETVLWSQKCIGQNGDQTSAGFGGYELLVGNFDNDKRNEIAHIRHSSSDITGDGIADGSYLRFIDDNGAYMSEYPNHPNADSTDPIYMCELGDFNGDGKDDVCLVQRYGPDNDNDNIKDESIMFTYDIYNHARLNGDGITNVYSINAFSVMEVLDYNGDGNDDVWLSSLIPSNSSSYTRLYSGGLTLSSTKYFPEELLKYQSADFDNDGDDELVAITDQGNHSQIDIYENGSTAPIYTRENSAYYCTHLNILNNEITDIEFINTVLPVPFNLSYPASNLTTLVSYFFNNIDDVSSTHLYFDTTNYNQLNTSSTAFGTETLEGDYHNFYWNPIKLTSKSYCTVSTRLRRLMYDMHYKLDNSIYSSADPRTLKVAKSIISHLRYLSGKSRFDYRWNGGMLFELPAYIDGYKIVAHMNNFSTIDEIINYRIDQQNLSVLDDGYYSESAYSYSVYFAQLELKFLNTIASNASIFPYSSTHLSEKYDVMKKMYDYYLYSVKPIQLPGNVNSGSMSFDLPIIGDSHAYFDRYTGKYSSGNTSILDLPSIYNAQFSSQFMSELEFAQDIGTGSLPIDFDVSKSFPSGRIFISRSNWKNSLGCYDNNARYCHFKVGKREGIANKGHMHSDLLSLDICGYDKNMLIDLGGYGFTNLTAVSNFDSLRFEDLYFFNHEDIEMNTASYSRNQYIFRHYFLGDAAHNTIYIPDYEQIDFIIDGAIPSVWGNSTPSIVEKPYLASSNQDLDYARGGYSKEGIEHDRVLIYNKPHNASGTVINDYWIVDDFIEGEVLNSNNNDVYQMWHISPDQNPSLTNLSNNTLHAETFDIVPLANTFDDTELLDGYYAPQDSYIYDTDVFRIRKQFTTNDQENIVTMIMPHSTFSSTVVTDFTKQNVYSSGGSIIANEDAQSFYLRFTSGSNVYEDYIFVAHTGGDYYYLDGTSKKTVSAKGKRLIINRFVNGALSNVSNMGFDSKSSEEVDMITKLTSGNYPNPFNPSTTISFNNPAKNKVKIDIYNVKGQKINTLVDEELSQGTHQVVWNGNDKNNEPVASGVYFYKIKAGKQTLNKKMLLIK